MNIDVKGVLSIKKVAKWFLKKESMTHRKLQKLCYYSEAWSIALQKRKLFNDTYFEGWVYGPVSPELYDTYKEYGWLEIPKVEEKEEIILSDILELLNLVYGTYKDFDGIELSELAHNEKPWIESREGYETYTGCNTRLNIETIYEYYNSIISKDFREA